MVAGPVRVLHVIDTLDIGGAQRHLLSLAGSMSRRGYRCIIATSGRPVLAVPEGVEVVSLSPRSISHRLPLRFSASLTRLLAGEQMDLVHAHLHASSLAAAVAATTHRLPLVVTHHSDRAWQPRYHRELGRRASIRAGQTIAVAHSLAAQLAADRIPVTTIPNGVTIPESEPSEADRMQLRARLRIPREAYVASFTGRFTEDKNPLLFVEMAAQVAAGNPSAHFLMVGDGPLRPLVQRRILRYGLEHRFTLTGFRTDADALCGAADVAVVCSRREACSLAALEAMATGLPVVGTPVGDLPHQIAGGRTGYIVRPNAPALAGAVTALSAPGLRARLGRAGRERAAEHYSLERMVDRTLDVYAALQVRPKTEMISAGRLMYYP